MSDRRKETEEERAARKERERAARANETPEQRAARKERERQERERHEQRGQDGQRRTSETPEEHAARKERERKERERAQRKAEEAKRAEEEARRKAEEEARRKAQVADDEDAEDDDDYDYEDDFEDDTPQDVKPVSSAATKIARAVAEENTALHRQGGAGAAQSSDIAPSPTRQVEGRKGLDKNSLERQRIRENWEREYARATALRRLVDLDLASYTIADFPPMTEYDLFIRNFGGVNASQTAVQAPHEADLATVELQTEKVVNREKSCQHPDDAGLWPDKGQLVNAADDAPQRTSHVDTQALASFLGRVFPVFRAILDENEVRHSSVQRRTVPKYKFSSSTTTLNFAPVGNFPVVKVTFSRLQPQYLVSVHRASAQASGPLSKYRGVALVWNVNDPKAPDRVLTSHAAITAACFSPTKVYLVYGGTENGSVCVWDTREGDHQHRVVQGEGYVHRVPTYTTDWTPAENHDTPVCDIQVAGYNSAIGLAQDADHEQLASLDASGVVHFWVVSEVEEAKTHPISESDLGLNVFGAVKMFKATTMRVQANADEDTGLMEATSLDFCPKEPGQFVVAHTGGISNLNRFGTICAPNAYTVGDSLVSLKCTNLHYCPMDSRLIIASYEDGSLRVFCGDKGLAHYTIHGSDAVVPTALRWSSSTRCVFYTLDTQGSFAVYDLASAERMKPVLSVSVVDGGSAPRCIDLSNDDKSDAKLAIGYDSGAIDIHALNDSVLANYHRDEKWI